ncbi:MAG: InlB B-repeat-containing protein [Acidimicrobiia bacterium]
MDHAGDGGGTVTSDPAGIDCGSDCTEDYTESTIVTLTANADALSVFIGWSGDCSGTGTCVVTMDSAKSVTATFDTPTLTVTKAGTGSGTVTSDPAGINCGIDCSESYVPGTSVTLTATAAGGGTFAGWSGACTGNGSCVLTVDADKTATAAFISPGSAEKIVYECVGDICVIDADGTGYTNLTNSMGAQDIDRCGHPTAPGSRSRATSPRSTTWIGTTRSSS